LKVKAFNSSLSCDPSKRLKRGAALRATNGMSNRLSFVRACKGLKRSNTPTAPRIGLQRVKGLNPVSKKMAIQKGKEAKLKAELLYDADNQCQYCHKPNMILDKHEIISRARGGNPLDKDNCIILCRSCHDLATLGKITPDELMKIKGGH
jgi:5-methylcytosine-specific restriction endonuclease McrA